MIGSTIKVVVTAENGNKFESKATSAVAMTEVKLKEVEQLKANSIELTFDQDASLLVDKEDITVEAADDTIVIPVNKLTFAEDGESAIADLAIALADGKEYNVKLGDSLVNFTASVGAVKSIAILTASAMEKEKTDIKFALYDEAGIDVTSTVNLDARCTVVVEGDNVTFDTRKASAATITMDKAGQEATVTVTYSTGKAGDEDIEEEGTIVCIDAEAKQGDPLYAQTKTLNLNSKCAKFYNGVAQTDPAKVLLDKEGDPIYFCATDKETGDVIYYDSYDVESSDDDTVAVSIDDNSGKFAKINIVGNKVGKASLVVTATKNGKDAVYTIPVTVSEYGPLDHITYKVSRPTLTNAIDEDYYGKITDVKGYDAANNQLSGLVGPTFELINAETKGGENHDIDDNVNTHLIAREKSGFQVDPNTGEYTAWNDKGGQQTIKLSVSKDDIVKTKNINITVDKLTESYWNDNKDETNAKLNYYVELGATTLKEDGKEADESTTARLAAYAGGKFAGYVRQDGADVFVGTAATRTETSQGVVYLEAPSGGKAVEIKEIEGTVTNRTVNFTKTAKDVKPQVLPTVGATVKGLTFTITSAKTAAGETGKAETNASKLNGLTVDIGQSGNTNSSAALSTDKSKLEIKVSTNADLTTGTAADVLTEVQAAIENPIDLSALDGTLKAVQFAVSGTYNKDSAATTAFSGGANYEAAVAKEAMVAQNGDLTINVKATDTNTDIATFLNGKTAITGLFTVTAVDARPDDTVAYGTYTPGVATTATVSPINIDAEYIISDITWGVKYGTKYSLSGDLFNGAANIINTVTTGNELNTANGAIPIDSSFIDKPDDGIPYVVVNDTDQDYWYAKAGAYTVVFNYTRNNKPAKSDTQLTVVRGFTAPKVNVTARVVDSINNPDDVIDVLEANVDMNNNTSNHESILGLAGKSVVGKDHAAIGDETDFQAFNAIDDTNDRKTVKYAIVQEDNNKTVINFYVNIDTTFRTE